MTDYNTPAIKRGDTMDPSLFTVEDKLGNVVAEAPTTGKLYQMLGMIIPTTELRTEDKPLTWLSE